MKKIKRKNDRCLNCGTSYSKEYNYCPNCGQQNTDNYQSVRILLGDFLNNYFSFDSRFVRTIFPFLFKPGMVTNEFIEGKRLKYAHPIRWYLVISLFHFFFFNIVVNQDNDNKSKQGKIIDINQDTSFDTQESVDKLLETPDSLRYKYEDGWQVSDFEYNVIQAMVETDTFSVKEIYDSLKIDQKPFLERTTSTILIKSLNSDTGSINGYLLEKVPIIMFFILPLYALLLKLFFFRKGMYIKHLVHSLNIHSFFFFILMLVWIMSLAGLDAAIGSLFSALLITLIYNIFSFRRVYKQKYYLLILKTFGIGILYMLVSSIVLLIGVIISMILM